MPDFSGLWMDLTSTFVLIAMAADPTGPGEPWYIYIYIILVVCINLMRSSLPIFPCKRSNTWLVTKCVRVNTCHGNPNRMGHDPQRTEYRSLMDMTWHLGATKIWGPPIPSLMLFDADSWLSQSATAPNSLFNPIFLYHIAQNGCYIMVYPVKSPAQKGKKNSAPPQSWPSSQERTALQPEGIRLGYSSGTS